MGDSCHHASNPCPAVLYPEEQASGGGDSLGPGAFKGPSHDPTAQAPTHSPFQLSLNFPCPRPIAPHRLVLLAATSRVLPPAAARPLHVLSWLLPEPTGGKRQNAEGGG